MSEKRPTYIQILTPKLEGTVATLEAAKGKERSWAEFAKESGINPSTMSRVINGKQKNPLTVKTLEKLFEHRDSGCDMEFDAFILNCSGLIDSDKQKDMVNDHMAARDEIDAVYDAIDQSVLNSLVNRYIAFSRVDHVGSGSPNEEEIMRLFGNIHSDFLMRAGEGEAAKTYGFEYVPLRLRDDERNDSETVAKRLKNITRTVLDNYASIFLEDAWELDERLSERVTIVFAERLFYETFLENLAKRTLHHDMTALLVDTETKKVIDEKPLGRQDGKPEFESLFSAPEQERSGRRFKE